MQNTSKIPNIPNTLVKNFFIAGVNQKTLASKILEKKATEIAPEVLFSMYQSKERVSSYLQFVFPEKIAVEYSSIEPRFFTFMTTDQEGFNTYIHVLIFFEEVNEAEISRNDFDILTEILRKQHLNKKDHNRNPKSITREGSNGAVHVHGGGDSYGTLFNQHRRELQEKFKSRNEAATQLNAQEISSLHDIIEVNKETKVFSGLSVPKTPHAKVNNILQNFKDDKTKNHRMKEQETKDKLEKLKSKINIHGGASNVNVLLSNISGNQSDYRAASYIQGGATQKNLADASATHTLRIEETKSYTFQTLINETKMQKQRTNNLLSAQQPEEYQPKSLLYQRPKSNAIKVVQESADRYSMQLNDNDKNIYDDQNGNNIPSSTLKSSYQAKVLPKGYDDYYGMNRSNQVPTFGGGGITHQEDPYARFSEESDEEDEFDDEYMKQNNLFFDRNTSNFGKRQSIMVSEQDDKLEYLYEKKSYVPVALCLETETEYHDVFRKILLTLFDEIRVPDDVLVNKIYENRRLAFAELVAHLAFLRTIPAPSFNSVYNIFLFNKLFTIKENTIDQLPNKNTYAIKILFDVLDVKSIFYCWKALLFDKSLVLVSSQYSLQFYVAEALKQLLFPLTWQNTYIQPGNENLAGHCDGTIVCLYGSNSVKIGFDFFEEMSPEMAVVDIDACYTNSIELPTIPDETMYIRLLNLLKNSRISQYDKAYPDTHMPESEDFVNQVREAFFGVLKPFLSRVDHYIDKSIDSNQAYFQKYFNHAQFLDDFSDYGDVHYRFAKELIQSSQFVHFCDDFFNDELNNYKVLKAIFKSRGELNDSPDTSVKIQIPNIFDSVSPDDAKILNFNKIWPETEPIVFNFRMPSDEQRFMLFEKILFMNEESLAKREKLVSRETNEHIIQNKDNLMYDQIIQDIKKMYPIKLKGIHQKYHDQNMKMLQQNLKRRQQALDSTKNANNGLKKLPTFFKNQESNSRYMQSRPSLDGTRLAIDIVNLNMRPRGSMRVTELDQRFPMFGQNLQSQKKTDLSGSKLQLDLISNDDFNGSSTVMNNNSFIELEYQRIKNCKRRISRLMYGKQGLMTFLHHIFGLLSEDQMKRVNYYFALKDQLRKLMDVERKLSQKQKEEKLNITIREENEDDADHSPTSREINLGSIRDRTKTQNMNPRQRKPPTKSPISSNNIDLFRRQITNPNIQNSVNGASGMKSVTTTASKIFKEKSDWINIENWQYYGCAIKRTSQFILFKTKMYETFECPDEGYSMIWKDLLKYPANQTEFFPLSKFMHIWQNLTQSQQEEQFIKLGQKQSRPFIQTICQDFIKQNKMRDQSTIISEQQYQSQERQNDENIFREATIDKNWVTIRQEKKDRELMQRQRLQHQKSSNNFSALSSRQSNQPDQKSLKKQNTKNDSRGSNVSEMIKQKLEKRRNPYSTIGSKNDMNDDSKDRTMYSQSGRSFFSEIETIFKMPSTESKADLNSSNSSMTHQDSQSILIDYNLSKSKPNREPIIPYQKMNNPEKVSQNLLLKIIKFWEQNSKYIEKKGQFKESELSRIQEEMKVYDKYFEYLRDYHPEVNTEIEKQVFFLNLYNFLVLYYLALFMFSNPDIIAKLTNYNMWQSFLLNCKVKLCNHTINAFSIKHSILRYKLDQPNISEFMLQTPQMEFYCQRFQIQTPDPLICFGFFIPIKKTSRLKVFNTMDFHEQLRQRAEEFLLKKLRFKNDSRFLFVPKLLDMYFKDLNQEDYIEVFRYIENRIYQSEGNSDVAKFLKELDQSDIDKNKIIIEPREFNWTFYPSRMKKLFHRPTPSMTPAI